MADRNSAGWHELGASELLKHQDDEEDKLWDTSPTIRPKFSHKSGSVYGQHLRTSHKNLTAEMTRSDFDDAGSEASRISSKPSQKSAYFGGDRSMISFRLRASTGGTSPHKGKKSPTVPRCGSASHRPRQPQHYEFPPGPGAYSPEMDRKGSKSEPGRSSTAWVIGTAGSKKKIGRGTSINSPTSHNGFEGVTPHDPAHHDVTSENAGGSQGVHIGYMSPGPAYYPKGNADKAGNIGMEFRKSQRMVRSDGYSAAMQTPETLSGIAVASYSPMATRNGDAIPFDHGQRLATGNLTFSKASRDQSSRVYISKSHSTTQYSTESLGPAGYDYMRLASIYGQSVKVKKKVPQPVDGRLHGGAEAQTFKLKGHSAVEMSQRQARLQPGPSDYRNERVAEAQNWRGHGTRFGTSRKMEQPVLGWNPTQSAHVITERGFTPVYISKPHSQSLLGAFSPGPALYSPGSTHSGRMKSETLGTTLGSEARFGGFSPQGSPLSPTSPGRWARTSSRSIQSPGRFGSPTSPSRKYGKGQRQGQGRPSRNGSGQNVAMWAEDEEAADGESDDEPHQAEG